MARLTHRDIALCNRTAVALHGHRDLATFPHHVLAALQAVVSADHLSYAVTDFLRPMSRPVLDPPDIDFPGCDEIFGAYMHQNPLVDYYRRTGDGSARTITDFVSRRQFQALPLYHEFYRRLGTEFQMATVVPDASLTIAIALSRGSRNFSERDRLCLDLLYGHIEQAYQNLVAFATVREHTARAGHHLASDDHGMMPLDEQGSGRAPSEQVWRLMREYFDAPVRHSGRLPEDLKRWVAVMQALFEQRDGVMGPPKPLQIERDGKRLIMRFLADHSGQPQLILEEKQTAHTPKALEAPLGLTTREAEVLFWVAQGKTNQDVAYILGAKPNTVRKHLENIYKKLGVENRTAAANRALEVLGTPTHTPRDI